jgi:HK97 family phage prohead protease
VPEEREERSQSVLTARLEQVEVRESGAGSGQMTLRGHAAVFNRLSHDLGGFRERIAPGAFTNVLDTNPDVHLVWDHDTSLTLARTRNNTLELREDPMGLHVWARLAPTTYASDLATLMDRGDIDQMSFKFMIGAETVELVDGEDPIFTIEEVSSLFDVTVTAQGAYPQTDAQLVRQRLERALNHGRVERRATASAAEEGAQTVAPSVDGDAVASRAADRKRAISLARAKTR